MADTTGQLHTGPAVNVGSGDAGAPAAKSRGGMFGGRRNNEVAVAEGGAGRRGGPLVNTGARIGLILSQLLTIIAFLIVLGGLSKLQKTANNTAVVPATSAIYSEAFQSAGQTPYPGQGRYQFGLQWWTLMFEIFIFLVIVILILMPRHLLRLRTAAMCFLVYVLLLTTLNVNSLLWFLRGSVLVNTGTALGVQSVRAAQVFGTRTLRVNIAGTIMGCVANCLSIIFLSLLRDHRGIHGGRGAGAGTGLGGGKRVGVDHAGHGTAEPGMAAAV